MSWVIKWTDKSMKVLKKLQDDIALRIWNKIEFIKENPFRYLQHFEGEHCYKLRIGDYRALIDIDFEKKILVIRNLDKRGRIYKR